MKTDLRTWAEINLDAIGHNVREIRKKLCKGVRLLAVVKADGYGHGAYQTAVTALKNGAEFLAVAFVDEAIELRRKGIDAPILILGNSTDDAIDEIVDANITATVSDITFARKLSEAAVKRGKTARIHIKIDTGMSRIGFLADNDANRSCSCDEILKIAKLPNLEIEGMFTHFASSDEPDGGYTQMQYDRFMSINEELEKNGLHIPIKHACNSAGIVRFPHMQLDMVRAGIIIYGMYPSRNFDKALIDLIPAMTFKSRITQIKDYDKGTCLSYGMTHTLEEKSRIATVSVGYADGYRRNLSGKAKIFVNGKDVEQLGRICMDQCMIDVTKVNNINVGDEVTLFGTTGVSVDCIAELLDTINYEVTCGISKRVPRIYIENGESTEICNHLMNE